MIDKKKKKKKQKRRNWYAGDGRIKKLESWGRESQIKRMDCEYADKALFY